MRHRQLRAFFLDLVTLTLPLSLPIGCGGVVASDSADDTLENGGTGAEPLDAAGTGGTGGYPFVTGTGGYPFAPGTGGYPFVTGTGGYPFVTGTGGNPPFPVGGTGGTGATYPFPLDAGAAGTAGASTVDAGTAGASAVDAGPSVLPSDACDGSRLDGGICAGRRPPGLLEARLAVNGEVRGYFGEMARLEAASITAFRILARELGVHGAPARLQRAAERSAREEVVHARLGRELARRYGATYTAPRVERRPPRNIEEIALDNAAEGCVRETFAAVLATWQANAAGDPAVRKVMRRVAVDETRHAAVAIRVAEWAEKRLDAKAVARVRAMRRLTGESVLRESAYVPSPALVAFAGVPRPAETYRLARALHERLWA